MKIFHIIRNQSNVSLFKEIIQLCIHSGLGDEAYISSGFFQEPPKGTYSAYNDADSQGRSFANNSNYITLHFIGVYSNLWQARFQTFISNLQSNGNYQIFVNQIPLSNGSAIQPRKNIHAKIFVYQDNGEPLVEIVGSSNFTSRAYGTGHAYNIEADLVICNCPKIERDITKAIEQLDNRRGIMILNYDETNSRPIVDEMKWIRDNLF